MRYDKYNSDPCNAITLFGIISVVCYMYPFVFTDTHVIADTHVIFSENRRHVVLSKPDASHADVDDILRKKWEKLSDKEKLRYFQRALNAIKDENRHSNRRHEEGMSIMCFLPSVFYPSRDKCKC